MSALLRAEALKLRTTRTFAAFVASALALALLVGVLAAALTSDPSEDEVRDMISFGGVSSLFVLVLAVVGMTGEWRHRTIASTVLAAPDRVRLTLAKMLAYAAAGVVLSVVVTVVVFLVVTIILAGRGLTTPDLGDLVGEGWQQLVVAAYYGALGVAVGALVRNQAGAIIVVLVVLLMVEPTLQGLVPDVGRFGPLGGAPSGFDGTAEEDLGFDPLAPGVALAVMAGWLALLGGAAIAVLRGRDLT